MTRPGTGVSLCLKSNRLQDFFWGSLVEAAVSDHGEQDVESSAFAAVAGASPLPASSGVTIRYRLNRGGDRKLNRALNVIAMHRMIHHQDTRDYVEKRLAQGKTYREIRRALKRYLARRYYRYLNNAMEIQDRGWHL